MPDRQNPQALFLEHREWIDRVAAAVCKRHGVWGQEAEDFASRAREKLIEDDYAVFRQFRGDSALTTYLAAVVTRHFHDYSRERRGRWRASAAAERLGSPAKELEVLVYRDGYRLEQAGEKLRTAGVTDLSDARLARLFASLPVREPLRPTEVSAPDPVLEAAEGSSRADERIMAGEAETRWGGLVGALDRAMARLEPEDLLIARMHFADGRGVADVARALGLEQKPLYGRVKRVRARLRELLEEEGVRGEDVRDVLAEEDAP